MDPRERAEQETIMDDYLIALDNLAEQEMIMGMCKAKMESGDDRS